MPPGHCAWIVGDERKMLTRKLRTQRVAPERRRWRPRQSQADQTAHR
jgi:hypothetical protein